MVGICPARVACGYFRTSGSFLARNDIGGIPALVFGFYAIFEGILLIALAVSRRSQEHWWVPLLQGIAGIIAGALTFSWPGITAVVLLAFIAAWALVTGVLEIIGAVRLRKEIKGEWALIVSGILSIVFALLLLVNPLAGALAVVWLIGIYAIIFGALTIALGLGATIWRAPE